MAKDVNHTNNPISKQETKSNSQKWSGPEEWVRMEWNSPHWGPLYLGLDELSSLRNSLDGKKRGYG